VVVRDLDDLAIRTLADNEPRAPGMISKLWYGDNDLGGDAPEGTYNFCLSARAGGDSTPVFEASVVLDITPPTIASVLIFPNPYAPDVPLADSLLSIEIDIETSEAGDWLIATLFVTDDPDTLCLRQLTGADSTYSCQWDGREEEDGEYPLLLRTRDRAGNTDWGAYSANLDLDPPELTFDFPETDRISYLPDSVAGTVDDRNCGVSRVEFRFSQEADFEYVTYMSPDSCPPNSWYITWPESLDSDGSYNLEARASDAAGHVTVALKTLAIDTTAPSAPELSELPQQVHSPSLEVSGTGTPNDSVVVFVNEQSGSRVKVPQGGGFSTTVSLQLGLNTVYAVAKDASGNSSPPSVSQAVEYTERPGIMVPEILDEASVIEVNLDRAAARIDLRIFSLDGYYIRTVVKESPSQSDEMGWNLRDEDGRQVKNGLYLLVFQILFADGSQSVEKRMVVVSR
jgi:hypothetical protein